MTIRLPEVSSARGAPMGRRDNYVPGVVGAKFYLERMPFVDGDYDCGGAYWGSGESLWFAKCEDPPECDEQLWKFVRARDRESAMFVVRESYEGATFHPETGSIIEQTIRFLNECLARDTENEDTESAEQEIATLEEQLAEVRRNQETK